jgi:hypothetical protein
MSTDLYGMATLDACQQINVRARALLCLLGSIRMHTYYLIPISVLGHTKKERIRPHHFALLRRPTTLTFVTPKQIHGNASLPFPFPGSTTTGAAEAHPGEAGARRLLRADCPGLHTHMHTHAHTGTHTACICLYLQSLLQPFLSLSLCSASASVRGRICAWASAHAPNPQSTTKYGRFAHRREQRSTATSPNTPSPIPTPKPKTQGGLLRARGPVCTRVLRRGRRPLRVRLGHADGQELGARPALQLLHAGCVGWGVGGCQSRCLTRGKAPVHHQHQPKTIQPRPSIPHTHPPTHKARRARKWRWTA